ncbi:hypothetical protein BGX38DRAFT_1236180, partial [Terfezia claveryi]
MLRLVGGSRNVNESGNFGSARRLVTTSIACCTMRLGEVACAMFIFKSISFWPSSRSSFGTGGLLTPFFMATFIFSATRNSRAPMWARLWELRQAIS